MKKIYLEKRWGCMYRGNGYGWYTLPEAFEKLEQKQRNDFRYGDVAGVIYFNKDGDKVPVARKSMPIEWNALKEEISF